MLGLERIDSPWPYDLSSPGICVGDLLFTSGLISIDKTGTIVGPDDFDVQAEQIFKNLGDVLAAGGSSFSNVIRINAYLTPRFQRRETIQALRRRYFTPPYPAATMVAVSGLAFPGLMLEVEAVALRNDAGRSG